MEGWGLGAGGTGGWGMGVGGRVCCDAGARGVVWRIGKIVLLLLLLLTLLFVCPVCEWWLEEKVGIKVLNKVVKTFSGFSHNLS